MNLELWRKMAICVCLHSTDMSQWWGAKWDESKAWWRVSGVGISLNFLWFNKNLIEWFNGIAYVYNRFHCAKSMAEILYEDDSNAAHRPCCALQRQEQGQRGRVLMECAAHKLESASRWYGWQCRRCSLAVDFLGPECIGCLADACAHVREWNGCACAYICATINFSFPFFTVDACIDLIAIPNCLEIFILFVDLDSITAPSIQPMPASTSSIMAVSRRLAYYSLNFINLFVYIYVCVILCVPLHSSSSPPFSGDRIGNDMCV